MERTKALFGTDLLVALIGTEKVKLGAAVSTWVRGKCFQIDIPAEVNLGQHALDFRRAVHRPWSATPQDRECQLPTADARQERGTAARNLNGYINYVQRRLTCLMRQILVERAVIGVVGS